MSNRSLAIFIAITILGIGLRLWWIFNVPTQQLYDFETFLETASNIYHGYGHSLNGNPIAWVGPGYSFVLAFFHFIVGNDNPFNAMLLNFILSTATLIMSAFVYAKWFPDSEAKQLIAYGATALFPTLIAYNNVAGTETLFLFQLVLILLARMYMPLGRKQAVVLGILCGLAALTKPFMLAYPAVAFATWWLQDRQLVGAFVRFAVMIAAMLIVIAPWSIRNANAFGQFILISYNMGYNQLINNNYANTHGGWMPLDAVPMSADLRAQVENSLRDGRTIKEAYELDSILAAEARHWMARNPLAVGQLAIMRVQRTFFNGAGDISQWAMNDWDIYSARTSPSPVRMQRNINFAQNSFDIIISIFSAAGLLFILLNFWPYVQAFFLDKHERIWAASEGIVFIHIAFFGVIVAAFEGQERYAHPVFIFFIFALIWLCSKKSENRRANY